MVTQYVFRFLDGYAFCLIFIGHYGWNERSIIIFKCLLVLSFLCCLFEWECSKCLLIYRFQFLTNCIGFHFNRHASRSISYLDYTHKVLDVAHFTRSRVLRDISFCAWRALTNCDFRFSAKKFSTQNSRKIIKNWKSKERGSLWRSILFRAWIDKIWHFVTKDGCNNI